MGTRKLIPAVLLSALSLFADTKLELRGKVLGPSRGYFRVDLRGVDQPYEKVAMITSGFEFKFGPLQSGSYLLSVTRRTGTIRRTVVVSPTLADKKGIVRANIFYSPADAALEAKGGLVSSTRLSIPARAERKLAEARKHLSKHRTDEAIASLKQATDYAPKFAAAWVQLGVIYFQRGDIDHAEEYFRKALTAEPASFEALLNLGGVLLAQGKLEEALENNVKAQATRPKDPLANAQLGLTYFQLSKDRDAEPYLRAAERIDPAHFTRPQLYLARIYMNRGDVANAKLQIRDYLRRYPDAENARTLRANLEALEQKLLVH